MNDLLINFLKETITFNFLWIVIATTLLMEFIKKYLPEKINNSKYYPLIALFVAAAFILLKTAIAGNWRDYLANLIFTALLIDYIYTACGKFIIVGIKKAFLLITGILGLRSLNGSNEGPADLSGGEEKKDDA